MKKILTKLWFIILMCRIEWHNRKYDDFMGVDLSCCKDLIAMTIYIKDNSCEKSFNMFEISKLSSKKYYDGYIRKGSEDEGFECTNFAINSYVDSTFSNRKLVVKHLKSYNLI